MKFLSQTHPIQIPFQNISRTHPEPATEATCVPGITSLPPSPLCPPPHFPDSSSNETKSRKTRRPSPPPLIALPTPSSGIVFFLGGESVDRDGLAGEPLPLVRVSSIREGGKTPGAGQQASKTSHDCSLVPPVVFLSLFPPYPFCVTTPRPSESLEGGLRREGKGKGNANEDREGERRGRARARDRNSSTRRRLAKVRLAVGFPIQGDSGIG